MVRLLTESPVIRTTLYTSEAALRRSVAQGVADVGVLYRQGFDGAVKSGAPMNMTWLFWGEGSSRSRLITGTEVYRAEWQLIGTTPLVSLDVTQLGDVQVGSMAGRLLPLFVLMTIIVGGVLLPATSLVSEKEKRTLNALTITPTTLPEVYVAKALLGIGVSMLMALTVLALNRAFGSQPLLLISTLTLGAVAASVFGVLLGSLMNDENVLLATLKAGGLILIAPALLQLVPLSSRVGGLSLSNVLRAGPGAPGQPEGCRNGRHHWRARHCHGDHHRYARCAPCPHWAPTKRVGAVALAIGAAGVRCKVACAFGSMRHDRDNEGGAWTEIRALRDDDGLGRYVRLLLSAHERGDEPQVRTQATRLLMDWPRDLQASIALLRRLRDVGN